MAVVDHTKKRLARTRPTPQEILDYGVAVPVVGLLVFFALRHDWSGADWRLLFWVAVIALAELLPVSAWRGVQVTMSFPFLMAVAFLYEPAIAFMVAFVGSVDPREFRREVSVWRAFFNRGQIAISTGVAGVLFHRLIGGDEPIQAEWHVLLGAATLSVFVAYAINTLFVAVGTGLHYRMPFRQVVREFQVGTFGEFVFFYIGMALLGVPLARLYTRIDGGEWTVGFFILPLLLARQMFVRSQELEAATNELRQREQVLRRLSDTMAEERYDERRQIAGYLHDDLAQMLFRLGLKVDGARSNIERHNPDRALQELDDVEELKDDSVRLVRNLIRDLDRSPIGTSEGLADALHRLAPEVPEEGTARLEVEMEPVDLPPTLQLLAYQIAREAVQNAMKHSGASLVSLSLRPTDDGQVVLTIADDGSGFDPEAAAPEGHFGLAIMRERARIAGGEIVMHSEPGEGTRVTVTFPKQWLEEEQGQESAPAAP